VIRLRAALAAVAVAGAGVGGAWQTPPPAPQRTPVFRGGITVVPLSVTVLDRRGAPITDLTQADFTVFENGKPREIVNFFLQRYEPGPAPPPPASINRVRDGTIAPQTRRTFLIVLGYGRIQEPTKALDGAIHFVRNRLLPQDAVAVMAFHRATNFTTAHDDVARLLERYKKDHERVVSEINQWLFMNTPPPGSGRGHAPIPDRFLAMIDDVLLGPAGADGRRAATVLTLRRIADMLLGMDRAVPVAEKAWQRQDRFADIQGDLQYAGVELNDAVLGSSRLKLFAGIEYLRFLDGDKHMLFFANGGLVRNDPDRRADHDVTLMAQRATDARVVVDLVATNGTNPRGGAGGDPWGREIAERTGGFYSSVDIAAKAVDKVDQGTRFSYLLGYEPSSPDLDGRYPDIEVRVSRPGVTLQFRHGYFAAAEPEPLELKALVVQSRVENALAYDATAKDIPLTASARLLPRMGVSAEARVEVTIDAAPLAFERKDGLRTAQLELQVYIGDAKQVVIGQLGERLDLEADDATHERWLKSGIRRMLRVPFIGEARYVKVVVYDYGSDRVGTWAVSIK
jgi:VWFA-related protein